MKKHSRVKNSLLMIGCLAGLNVMMYLTIHKFWIGGSSFLPLIGILGTADNSNAFLFAFVVNIGVIIGAFLGAYMNGEFRLRRPKRQHILRAASGGILIGMGITLAPGTCTTVFITGIPMLSVSSFLSAAGIFIGAYIMYRITVGEETL